MLASDSSFYFLLSSTGRIFHIRPLARQRIFKWAPTSPGSHQLVHDTSEGQQLCPGTTLLYSLLTSSAGLPLHCQTDCAIVHSSSAIAILKSCPPIWWYLQPASCRLVLSPQGFPRVMVLASLWPIRWSLSIHFAGLHSVFPLLEPICYYSISCTEQSEWRRLATRRHFFSCCEQNHTWRLS